MSAWEPLGVVTPRYRRRDTLVAMGTNASDVLAVTFTAGNAIDVDLTGAWERMSIS